jgi:hypothetical protein
MHLIVPMLLLVGLTTLTRTEWALVAVGFLGFGLAALGHYAIGERWLTGAGFLVAGVACIGLAVLVQQRPPR